MNILLSARVRPILGVLVAPDFFPILMQNLELLVHPSASLLVGDFQEGRDSACVIVLCALSVWNGAQHIVCIL